MRLLLTVLGPQRSTLGDRSSHVFETSGGAIGRSAGCDWSLPNASNTLSARHALISYNGHGFMVTDTSTNGVYLNSVDAPLGRDQSRPLANGDMLYIADYVLSVSVLKQPSQEASPLHMPPPAAAVFSAPPQPAAPFPLPPATSTPGFALPPGVDFGLSAPPVPKGTPIIPDFSTAMGTAFSSAPQTVTTLPAQRAALIPDDFDFSDLAPHAPKGQPQFQAAAPTPVPVPEPAPLPLAAPDPGPVPAEPSLDPLALLRQRAVARAATIDLSRPTAETGPANPRLNHPAIDDVALPGGRTMAAASDAAAFWQALGVDGDAIPAASRQRLLAELGGAMREMAAGLVMVLSARKSMKDEFRLDQTRLAPQENNPFKFFRNGDEALRRILVEGKPGYLPLDHAVRQCFADIKAHEIATAIAMQNGLRKLIANLAPAEIESDAEPGLLGRKPDRARLWDRYSEMHAGLVGDIDRTMRDLLADEFARAYAEQTQAGAMESPR
jgi:type VI secretion system FHA domain protein